MREITRQQSWMGFWTVLRREITRFWGIKRQTILGPLLETYLYISVFGAALGSRISSIEGVSYVVFILPGLLMMAFAINTFSNNASSLMQQKVMRAIDDQLSSPVSNTQLMSAFALGGLIRASMIVAVTYATAWILIDDLPMVHPWLFVLSLALIGLFFSMAGVLVGLRAEKFDDLSFYQTFILQPLIFLGGIFYSAALLPEPFSTIVKFNPLYYMINTVRYSMLGQADVKPLLSLSAVAVAGLVLFLINYRLFQKGYKLRG